jgi:hypothetical protein
MARRSLKPQLNQIRAWVRQGRTDAWIAHQLEVSASELREFRKQHELTPDEEASQEVDLRDEIEAEIEAAAAEEAAAEEAEEAEEEAEAPEVETGEEAEGEEAEGEKAEGEARPRRRRRRGRRGGRGRRREYEASFDHGETEGYGLWLDPSVAENPVYLEHWAGKREVTVRIDPDQIVIRRAGSEEPGESDE